MTIAIFLHARRKALKAGLVLLGGVAVCGLLFPGQASAQGYISRLLNRPHPGGVAVIPIPVDSAGAAVRAYYHGRPVMMLSDSDGRQIAVVGIDLKTSPGPAVVQWESGDAQGTATFVVEHKEYKQQHIRLKNRSHIHPDVAQLKRYEREYQEQIRAYSAFRAEQPSNISLDKPVEGRLSSPFGLRRFFNGEERNPHSGLDFAVPHGTPVKAPADGRVTIVADYFFNGKTVFLDHGQGLVTMYCHLSAFDVKPGQHVKRGEVIARVGASGRATGPHLHWNVSLNNARVDPAIFIQGK